MTNLFMRLLAWETGENQGKSNNKVTRCKNLQLGRFRVYPQRNCTVCPHMGSEQQEQQGTQRIRDRDTHRERGKNRRNHQQHHLNFLDRDQKMRGITTIGKLLCSIRLELRLQMKRALFIHSTGFSRSAPVHSEAILLLEEIPCFSVSFANDSRTFGWKEKRIILA